nr:histidine phosphatase family protein [Paenibacillus soyae]
MVRHAESPYALGEEKTRGLSREGAQEAKKAADLLEGVEIHAVCSSSYARARETVQELAERRELPIMEYDELVERSILGLEVQAPWEDIVAAIKRSFEDEEYALPGGESTRAAQQRAIPLFERLLEQYAGRSIAIGTHGNIMTIIMNYYDSRFGYDFWQSTSKPDIYRMVFDNRRLTSVERIWK